MAAVARATISSLMILRLISSERSGLSSASTCCQMVLTRLRSAKPSFKRSSVILLSASLVRSAITGSPD